MQQLKMAQAALVDLFDAVEVALDEHGPFGALHDRRLPTVVRGSQVFEVQGAVRVALFQLCVDGGEPVKEVVSRIAGLVVLREVQNEGGADGGEAGLLQLPRER